MVRGRQLHAPAQPELLEDVGQVCALTVAWLMASR